MNNINKTIQMAFLVLFVSSSGLFGLVYGVENPPVVIDAKEIPEWVNDPTLGLTVKGVYGKARISGDDIDVVWGKSLQRAKTEFTRSYPDVKLGDAVELGRYHKKETNELLVWFGIKLNK